MFESNDSIKFMMAKIFLNMAEFKFDEIKEATILKNFGANILVLYYIEEGNGNVIINDNKYQIEKNSYFVISQFSKCQIIPIDKIKYYSIYFIVDKTTAFKKYEYLANRNYIGINDRLSYYFNIIKEELKNQKFGYNEVVVSMYKTIIVNILRNEKIDGERLSHWDLENRQFEIDKIIENEFQNITIEELSKRLFLSVRELQRYFKENYKKTFIELKNDARMSYAKNKLLYSNMNITEIAEIIGYSSIAHFTIAFKKYYGLSPLKYRKNYKQ